MSVANSEPAGLHSRWTILRAFECTLNREIHNLQRCSELTRQQLYNRLQWEDEPVPQLLAPELERRGAPGATPWLWANLYRSPVLGSLPLTIAEIPRERQPTQKLAAFSGFVPTNALVVTLLSSCRHRENYPNVPLSVPLLATACNSRITQNSRRAET